MNDLAIKYQDNIILPQQGTLEWHEFRKNYIGASDAIIIDGLSPWRTKHDLYLEKIGLGTPQKETAYMRRGKALEMEALCTFESLTGYLMMPKVILHPTIEYMMASFDGVSLNGDAFVEIKCPGPKDHRMATELGKVPPKYYPQLQHQIEVSGLDKIYYFSFDIYTWKVIEVYRDDIYIKTLLEKEAEFWHCVQTKKEPKENDMPMRI